MKCQSRECTNEATLVRDVPYVGDSLCLCRKCVDEENREYNEDFGWYELTPERAIEEEQAEEWLRKAFKELTERWKRKPKERC